MTLSRMTIPLVMCLLVACGDKDDDTNPPGPQDDTGTGDGGAGGDAGGGDAGGDGGGVPVESDCEDGTDDDSDGVADCMDSDCVDYWRCNLPDSMSYHTVINFDGRTIECEAIGIEFDVDIDDCHTDASSSLALYTQANACPKCDRTYYGSLTYAVDSCSSLLETPPVYDATFGFVFISPDQRQLWVADAGWVWYPATVLVRQGDLWAETTSSDIIMDPEDCDNGDQNLGTMTLSIEFRDL